MHSSHPSPAEKRLPLWAAIKLSAKEVWRIAPWPAAAAVGTSVVSGLISPCIAFLLSLLILAVDPQGSGYFADAEALPLYLVGLAGLLVVLQFSQVVGKFAKQLLDAKVKYAVANRILEHAASLDIATLEHHSTKNILDRAHRGAGKEYLNLLLSSVRLLTGVLQISGYIGVLMWISALWTGVLLLSIPPVLCAHWWMNRWENTVYQEMTSIRRWMKHYAKHFTSSELAINLRMLNIEPIIFDRYRSYVQKVLDTHWWLYLKQAILRICCYAVATVLLIAVLSQLAKGVEMGAYTLASFASYCFVAWRLKLSVTEKGQLVGSLFSARQSLAYTLDYFALRTMPQSHESYSPSQMQGKIVLSDVSFRYANAEEFVLEAINLTFYPEEHVAIVGANGAGKSTLLKLIAGIYQPTTGEIQIDDHPLRDYERPNLYRHLGLVLQQTVKFEGTAAENIALGDWETLSTNRPAIEKLAKQSGIHEVIEELPTGYDTLLGRMFGEVTLSGGQWRRMGLTRALARDRRILLLDEPTVHLDVFAEQQAVQWFRTVGANRTMILVTHDLDLTLACDRVIVLEYGRVLEDGSPEQLISKRGRYAEMIELRHQDARRLAS